MHSTEFTSIARAADQNGWVVIAIAEAPAMEGCLPHGWAVLVRDHGPFPDAQYIVSQYVNPTCEGREPFFGSSSYDMTRERAFEVWTRKVERDCSREGVVA